MTRLILPFLLILILSSCISDTDKPTYPVVCSGKVTVEYNSLNIEADVYFDNLTLSVGVIVPEISDEIEFVIDDSGTVVRAGETELLYGNGELEDLFPFSYLYKAFVHLNAVKPDFIIDSRGAYCARFDFEGEKCEVYLSKDDHSVSMVKYNGLVFNFMI